MTPRILMPLDCPGQLNPIFNSYLHHLRGLESVVTAPLSMVAYAAQLAAEEDGDTQPLAEMSGMLRGLYVLSDSLGSLAHCLTEAYLDLEEFATEGANLAGYAARKRVEDAEIQGYDEEADVSPDGLTLVLRTEPEALAPFQLHTVLANYFPSTTAPGERIGSSGPEAYAYYTGLLANDLIFSLRDNDQAATPANLTTYKRSEAAALGIAPEEADERFDEVDTSLSGPELVAAWGALLQQCQEAAALFASLQADDAAGHVQLFRLLVRIVDGDGADAAEVLSHVAA